MVLPARPITRVPPAPSKAAPLEAAPLEAAPLEAAALGLVAGFGAALLTAPAPLASPVPLLFLAVWAARAGQLRLALLAFGVGAACAPGPAAPLPGPQGGRYVAFTARVEAAPPPGRGGGRIVVRPLTFGEPPRGAPPHLSLNLRLPWRTLRRLEWLCPGAVIRGVALLDPQHARTWAGTTYWTGRIPSREALQLESAAPFLQAQMQPARRHAARRLRQRLRRFDEGIARALLLGDRTQMGRLDRHRIATTGQAHVLAVSGMHVALVGAGAVLLLRRVPVPAALRGLLALLLVGFYVPLAGAPASAMRAGWAALLLALGRRCGRAPRGTDVLIALIVLSFLFSREELARPGLQLSLLAVTGILLLTPGFLIVLGARPRELAGLDPQRFHGARVGLAVSLSAWISTTSVIMALTGRQCLVAAPLSLLVAPLIVGLLATGALILVVGELPLLGPFVGACFAGLADVLRLLLDLVRTVGLDARHVAPPSATWCVSHVVALCLVAVARPRWSHSGALLLIALLVVIPSPTVQGAYDGAAGTGSTTGGAMTGSELGILALLLALFALVAASPACRWLTRGAATAAFGLGLGVGWAFGVPGLVALFTTFLVTTLLGRLPGAKPSAARNLRQVMANGLPALLGVGLFATGAELAGLGALLGALACLGGDTASSEIGLRYGGVPRRFLRGGHIQPGESGGVTMRGMLASLAGAALAPAAIWMAADLGWRGALYCFSAGVLGTLVDSALGDLWQYRGLHPETGAVTERTRIGRVGTERVSGFRLLDNDGVNLAAGLIAAALGALAMCYLPLSA